jgi:hypothetical protein
VPLQGLSQGGRILKLCSSTQRRLRDIDTATAFVRHITNEKVVSFMVLLGRELDALHAKPAGTATETDWFRIDDTIDMASQTDSSMLNTFVFTSPDEVCNFARDHGFDTSSGCDSGSVPSGPGAALGCRSAGSQTCAFARPRRCRVNGRCTQTADVPVEEVPPLTPLRKVPTCVMGALTPAKEMSHDLEVNFNKGAPFSNEATAKELQHAAEAMDQCDVLVGADGPSALEGASADAPRCWADLVDEHDVLGPVLDTRHVVVPALFEHDDFTAAKGSRNTRKKKAAAAALMVAHDKVALVVLAPSLAPAVAPMAMEGVSAPPPASASPSAVVAPVERDSHDTWTTEPMNLALRPFIEGTENYNIVSRASGMLIQGQSCCEAGAYRIVLTDPGGGNSDMALRMIDCLINTANLQLHG